MASDISPYKGTVPQAAFVLAFVKRDEISRFLLEHQPIKAIARYFDRNEDTVDRAIRLLQTHESDIGKEDVMAVAKVVWRGRLGWERSKSFTDARAHIERGELIPKGTGGPKRKVRRKTQRGEGSPADPSSPATTHDHSGASGTGSPPSAPLVSPGKAGASQDVERDDVLAGLTSMPLVAQASRVADSSKVHRPAKR